MLQFPPALLKVFSGQSWAQPPPVPSSLQHQSILCGAGQAGAGEKAPEQGFLLLLSPCRSRAVGLRRNRQGPSSFAREHVLQRVLCLTLGEVVFLPNHQSLTPLHWVPVWLSWWDRGTSLAAREAPAQPCPCPVPCGKARLAPCMPGGCIYSRSGNSCTAFLPVPFR